MFLQLIVILCLSGHAFSDDEPPMLSLPGLGLIRGKIGKTHFTDRTVYQFFGINYAKPPSKERRFKPPEAFGPWTGVYNATKMRQRCPQVDMDYYPTPDPDWLDVKQDIEDCLVLNIFTTNITPNTPRAPVMFYIHGGSFYLGSAYDFLPDFLLEEDIVLVVVQYRLGPLGFLSLNTMDIPGNMGLLDILLALQWVKTNIYHFGGDPAKITVVGQSAGAAAASSLLISPLVEKGLFDKMIIQSGSVLGTWAVDENPIQSARGIARMLDCPTGTVEEMTKCLKSAKPLDIAKAHSEYMVKDTMAGGRGLGGRSLVVRGPSNFLDKPPVVSFDEGCKTMVPIMGGTTRDEGSTFLATIFDSKMLKTGDERYFQRNVTRDLLKYLGYDSRNEFLNDASQYMYFGSQNRQLKDMYPGLVDMLGVTVIKQGTYDILRRMSYTGRSYAYSFNFYGGVSKLRASLPQWDKEYPFPAGIGHSDELGYLFPSFTQNYTNRELMMARTMTTLWTNFVKHGSPTTSGDSLTWPPMANAYGPYLRIADVSEVKDSFLDEYTVNGKEGFLSGGCPQSHPLVHIVYLLTLCILFGLTL